MSTSSKKSPGREVVSLLLGERVQFTLPPMKSLPWELQEKVGDLNDTIGVLEETLGRDKVQEMYRAGYQLGDLEVIALDWQKRSGLESGESRASSNS